MGIREAILNEIREQGLQQGIEQSKIKGIQKALQKNLLTLEQIADLFEVSLEFVLQVQRGEIQ